MISAAARDYPNDKGQYPNKCCSCGEWFIGEKGKLNCALFDPHEDKCVVVENRLTTTNP